MFNQQELKDLTQRGFDKIRDGKLKHKECGFCGLEAYYKLKKKNSPFQCYGCLAINKYYYK